MRILHCLRAPVGGLFRHVLDLAGEQARRGHDVGIIADKNTEDRLTGPKFAAIAPSLKLGVHRIPMSRQPGIGDYAAYRAVEKHARTIKPGVLHGHGAKGGAYARLTARTLSRSGQTVKTFYTPHGGSLHFKAGTVQSAIFLSAERTLERYASGLIFESAYAAGVYRERIGEPKVPYRVIPNGLMPADFERATPKPDVSDVLYIGELRGLKGVDLLLDALSALNRTRAVTATIAGAGPDGEKLKARAHDLGLSNQVVFTGALPARTAFTLGRIMVVPSRAESFPYVVLEAAAAGLPLISTSVGGIPEITSGTATRLIEAGSSQAIQNAITAVLDDPSAAAARANELRANVEEKFTVNAMTAAVLDFYQFTKP